MAKATTSKNYSVPYTPATAQQKEAKLGGERYKVVTETPISGQKLLVGYVLTECNDGWFQAYSKEGMQLWFRLGKETISKLKEQNAIQ